MDIVYEKTDKEFIVAAYLANAFFSLGGYLLILLWFIGRGLYAGHVEVKRHLKQITILWVIWLIGAGISVFIGGTDVFVSSFGYVYFLIPTVVYLIGAVQVWRNKDFALF